jgi:hypothetical protein
MPQADRDISHLVAKFLLPCDENRSYPSRTMVLKLKNKYFRFLSYPQTTYLCRHPVRFWSKNLHSSDHRFLIPLMILFRADLYIWCTRVHCCYWPLSLSAILTASWVRTRPNAWLKSTTLIIQKFAKVEMSISWFLERKSQLSFEGIIHNPRWFVLKFKYFQFFSYPRIAYLCKHPVRFSSIESRCLEKWLLVPLPMIFRVTSCIGHSILYYN